MGGLLSFLYFAVFLLLDISRAIPIISQDIQDFRSLEPVTITAAGQRSVSQTTIGRDSPSAKLELTFVNNLPDTPQLHAYIIGRSTSGDLVMLQSDNEWNHISSQGSPIPVKITSTANIVLKQGNISTAASLPDYILSSRIFLSQEELTFAAVGDVSSIVEPSVFNPQDPNVNASFGFMELDYQNDLGVFDISYVDWVGLPLGITVTDDTGTNQSIPGLAGSAVPSICRDLRKQAQEDGQPWDQLCQNGSNNQPLRVWSPAQYVARYPNTLFNNYFTQHIHDIWNHYVNHTLTISTQSAGAQANVTCHVHPSMHHLTCSGDNRSYAKPSANDIFGCNTGPFALGPSDNAIHRAVVPRLCAALNRGTLLLPGGHVQPSTAICEKEFYPRGVPSNQYSRIVHEYEIGGKGYAFSYDDVSAGSDDPAGLISVRKPVKLTVTIGGEKP